MANYVFVDSDQLDADLKSVADTIRAKGGTSAQLAFPGGFNSAVNAITTGVTVLQDTGNTFKTSSGAATVNCGFQPDFVEIVVRASDGENDDISFCAVFTESTDTKYCAAFDNSRSYPNGYTNIGVSPTGFSVSNMEWFTDDWSQQIDDGNTYYYRAYKFT